MRNVLIIAGVMCITISSVLAQTPSIDSLQKVIGEMRDDTAKVNRLNDLVTKLQYSDPSKALITVQQAMILAEKNSYPLGQAVAYRLRGVLYADQTKLDSARFFYNKALAFVEGKKDKNSLRQFGLLKHNYGVLYHQKQEMDSATLFYFQAAAIYKEIGEEELLFFPYANLVAIYSFLKDNQKALQYGIESRKAAQKLNDPSKLAMAINNEMAARLVLKQYDSVVIPLRQNIKRATAASNKYAIAKANQLLGLYFADDSIKQYDSAVSYFNNALKVYTATNNQYEMASVLHMLGYTYKGKKEYDKAIEYLKRSNELAQLMQLDQVVYYNLENLVDVEEAKGNIPAAYKYLKDFLQVKDSLQVRNNQDQVNNLDKKYQTALKDNQIKLQTATIRQKNMLNYILIGGASALLIISVLGFRNYTHRQKLQQQRISELETEKKLEATEAILKGEEQERSRLAKDLHDGLGGMLSGVKYSLGNMKEHLILTQDNAKAFEHSIHMLDNSIIEMRRVAHNMMPESLMKFGLNAALRDFCSQVSVSGVVNVVYQSMGLENKAIEHSLAITIYRVVQELLNNAMRHAAAHQVIVQISQEAQQLTLTVEDDGKGFDSNELKTAKGIGWKNINSRLDYHNGKLNVQSSPERGTSVFIEFAL